MTFELRSDLSLLDVDNFDFWVGAPNSEGFGGFVERQAVGNGISSIDRSKLLNHSDIPKLNDSVRVACRNISAINRKLTVINCIQMAVESLDGQTSSHIPDGCAPICGATYKEVSEKLEIHTVNWVGVRSKLLTHF